MRQELLIGCLMFSVVSSAGSAFAADPEVVTGILANVPVFVPTTKDGTLLTIAGPGQNKKDEFVYAAMSPNAASVLQSQVIKRFKPEAERTTQFTVMPITQLRDKIQSLNTAEGPKVALAYIPDPQQIGPAISSLVNQGIKRELAVGIAQSQPVFFCPQPLLSVSQEQNGSKKTFSPCGQDFVQMALLILSPDLKGSRPGIQAIPLAALEETLQKQPNEQVSNLLLLPPLATEQALQEQKQLKPSAGKDQKSTKQAK